MNDFLSWSLKNIFNLYECLYSNKAIFLGIAYFYFFRVYKKWITNLLIYLYRGKAQMIRYLLEYLNISYEEKSYKNPDDWFKQDKCIYIT